MFKLGSYWIVDNFGVVVVSEHHEDGLIVRVVFACEHSSSGEMVYISSEFFDKLTPLTMIV